MRRFVLGFVLVLGCGDGGGDPASTSSETSAGTTDTSTSTGAEATASMSSTNGVPNCDAPPTDCVTCWECAEVGACATEYNNCASSFECAGSLACVGYMCTPDGITQECTTHCCQNCAEHFTCPLVDAMITCVENVCADLCGPATCMNL